MISGQGADDPDPCHEDELKRIVRAVAKHTILALLAAAKIDLLLFLGDEFLRDELRPLVAAVAERLRLAEAASTPVVFLALLDFYGERGLGGDVGCAHINL